MRCEGSRRIAFLGKSPNVRKTLQSCSVIRYKKRRSIPESAKTGSSASGGIAVSIRD